MIDDQQALDPASLAVTTTTSPDKAAIKDPLKAGQQIPGAQLLSRRTWRITCGPAPLRAITGDRSTQPPAMDSCSYASATASATSSNNPTHAHGPGATSGPPSWAAGWYRDHPQGQHPALPRRRTSTAAEPPCWLLIEPLDPGPPAPRLH